MNAGRGTPDSSPCELEAASRALGATLQHAFDPTDLVFTFRLVGGLASENVRWAESVKNFKSQGVTLCGDVLLISAFVSYVGYFTKKYRNELMEKFWVPYINQLKVRGSVAFITQEIWGGPPEVGGRPSQTSQSRTLWPLPAWPMLMPFLAGS